VHNPSQKLSNNISFDLISETTPNPKTQPQAWSSLWRSSNEQRSVNTATRIRREIVSYLEHVLVFIGHVLNDDGLVFRYCVGYGMLFRVEYSLETNSACELYLASDYIYDLQKKIIIGSLRVCDNG
jgi:hypothetical protein